MIYNKTSKEIVKVITTLFHENKLNKVREVAIWSFCTSYDHHFKFHNLIRVLNMACYNGYISAVAAREGLKLKELWVHKDGPPVSLLATSDILPPLDFTHIKLHLQPRKIQHFIFQGSEEQTLKMVRKFLVMSAVPPPKVLVKVLFIRLIKINREMERLLIEDHMDFNYLFPYHKKSQRRYRLTLIAKSPVTPPCLSRLIRDFFIVCKREGVTKEIINEAWNLFEISSVISC